MYMDGCQIWFYPLSKQTQQIWAINRIHYSMLYSCLNINIHQWVNRFSLALIWHSNWPTGAQNRFSIYDQIFHGVQIETKVIFFSFFCFIWTDLRWIQLMISTSVFICFNFSSFVSKMISWCPNLSNHGCIYRTQVD